MAHCGKFYQIFSTCALKQNVALVSVVAVSVIAVALVAWAASRTWSSSSAIPWVFGRRMSVTSEDRAFFDKPTSKLLRRIGQFLRSDPQHSDTPTESFTTRDAQLTVYQMPMDGDSLFAALAHQIFCDPLNSPEHVENTAKLRSVASKNLSQFLEDYEGLVWVSVSSLWPRYEHLPTVEARMRAYVEELGTPGFHGGPEVIKIVADLLNYNVAVFPEGEAMNFVRATNYAVNVVGLGERQYRDKEGRLRSQYDSIKEVAMLEAET